MRCSGRHFLLCLALPLLGAAQARAAEPPRTLFKFSAGSALLARPAVGQGGAIYVGSADGYVHALRADGGFRWSYTVKGRVIAPPVEDPSSGRVFVATSEKRLYALEADSHLRWVFPLPAAPRGELLMTPKGTLFFVGQDDHLYGLTAGGALNLRLAAPAARSSPVWLGQGPAALVLGTDIATLKGYGYERRALAFAFGAAAQLELAGNGGILSCEDGSARARGVSPELAITSDCLAPPVQGTGFFAVAEADGSVRLRYTDGSEHRLPLGSTPLRPVWDGARRRLIVASADGNLSVLELPR